jgi:hypothetical protein
MAGIGLAPALFTFCKIDKGTPYHHEIAELWKEARRLVRKTSGDLMVLRLAGTS